MTETPVQPPTPPTVADPELRQSRCDVCSVVAGGGADGVLIAFGERGPSAAHPLAEGVAEHHRVVMASATAAKLQDLLLALLNEPAPEGAGGVR